MDIEHKHFCKLYVIFSTPSIADMVPVRNSEIRPGKFDSVGIRSTGNYTEVDF
jgi:hypothetical protein